MAQKVRTNKPDKPISGNSVTKGSIAGRKTQFVLQSNTVSVSFTVAAGSYFWVNGGAAFWGIDLPVEARNASNLIQPEETILLPQTDVYIDHDSDGDYYIGSGDSLSVDQYGVVMSTIVTRTPPFYDDAHTARQSGYMLFNFENNGALDHTVYFYLSVKYIVFADVNL